MSDQMTVFDRATVRRHRDRAAAGLDAFDFLFRESAHRLADRLDDMTRTFPVALDLGCHGGELAAALSPKTGIETLVQADLSPAMAGRAGGLAVTMDEEFLPFAQGSLDAVLSNLSLHWVNDLPGALLQIRHALKPDGLFLAGVLGGETLHELRHCLTQAEVEVEGGLSPRVSPFADGPDLGSLLQRAGFALPVVDSEIITVRYENPLKLLSDLRGMGESNAIAERRKGFMRRATLMRAMQMYMDEFGGDDGRVPATFHIIWMHAWAPHESQQKPLRPGSASARLADALNSEEIGLGVKPGRD
ncbi:SAM-dependent methyltransferase, BioC [Caenispirillum salinarum AK4]|uniref:SAM-dependent methyltransferase, BioC n=1 Tax=Caenispirillum salinarum AK4 TaxID=1238182 RepID=K9H5P4_9PROT|nr:methyltransferase domain-containing protein [Caenispirillum salinarum]EKV32907.1 SAM-dependent methyltransferase, BioC [Caenispirillum salinarum AK4]